MIFFLFISLLKLSI